jgi:hypothetical protein
MSPTRRHVLWLSFSLIVNVTAIMISIKMRFARGLVVEGWTVVSPLLTSSRWIESTSDPPEPPPAPKRPNRWQVGDQVSFTADGRMRSGMITESNGGGWFRVLLDDSTVRSLRTYQLQPPAPEPPEEQVSVNQTFAIESTVSPSDEGVDSDISNGVASTSQDISTDAERIVDAAVRATGAVISAPEPEPSAQMPPPPTIFDLDAEIRALPTDPAMGLGNVQYMRQVENHMRFDRWVVFTDLHCSPATLDTCLQVLDRVHEIALERQAGVMFLGDFWHHRGVLRVECLNAVLLDAANDIDSWESRSSYVGRSPPQPDTARERLPSEGSRSGITASCRNGLAPWSTHLFAPHEVSRRAFDPAYSRSGHHGIGLAIEGRTRVDGASCARRRHWRLHERYDYLFGRGAALHVSEEQGNLLGPLS